jgi:hypothetical protein
MQPLPSLTGLRAAGGDDIVAERTTPDGQLDIYVRPGPPGAGGYSTEIVLRTTGPLPVIVSVRYQAGDLQQEILVPITRPPIGPPAADAWLPALQDKVPWEVSEPQLVSREQKWPAPTVAASVQATPESNLHAWPEVTPIVQEDMRDIISRALTTKRTAQP